MDVASVKSPIGLWTAVLKHGCTILSGYNLLGGPLFIPTKAAQWHMKPNMTDLPGLEIPGSEAVLPLCSCIVRTIEQAY